MGENHRYYTGNYKRPQKKNAFNHTEPWRKPWINKKFVKPITV